MRVIVTRPGPQAGKWVSALRDAGLDALALPLIEIAGPPDAQAVLNRWHTLSAFDALMFVSANAVAQFFALKPQGMDISDFNIRYFVTGPGSVAALLKVGVPRSRIDAPDEASAQFDSEALWRVVQPQVHRDWHVLIVRGNSDAEGGEESAVAKGVGRDWFAAQLQACGATAEFVVSYVRRAPLLGANALALVQVAAVDNSVWLFSSSEAVANLCAVAAGQSWGQARAVATHPRIAQAARAAGFAVVRESRPAMADLLASIESLA
jgi:uroporphyrinogen-III synthase